MNAADGDIWRGIGERGEYVEIHRPPYKIVLDGRFTIEELELIVKVAKNAEVVEGSAGGREVDVDAVIMGVDMAGPDVPSGGWTVTTERKVE